MDEQSSSGLSRPGWRKARDEGQLRKRDLRLNEIWDLGPPTRRSLIAYRGISWLVFTVVAGAVGALVTWAATKAIGPALAGGLGAAILIWTVMSIKKVIYIFYVYAPIHSKAEDSKKRARWKDIEDERDRFLRAAVANKRNPTGRRPEEYPAPCRELIGSMARIAGQISAAIRIVDCSRDSVTIDTWRYFIDSIKKELASLSAKDNKRLTVQCWSVTKDAKITETLNG